MRLLGRGVTTRSEGRKPLPHGKTTATLGKSSGQVIGQTGSMYDPVLERYIGRRVVVTTQGASFPIRSSAAGSSLALWVQPLVSPAWARGIVAALSGLFMILMGISMLGIFPWLNKITPTCRASCSKAGEAGKGKGPFIVGLFNGLMPCGPVAGDAALRARYWQLFCGRALDVPLQPGHGAAMLHLAR